MWKPFKRRKGAAPEKIRALERAGVRVVERVPSIIEPLDSTADYLRTKREKMGHLLDP